MDSTDLNIFVLAHTEELEGAVSSALEDKPCHFFKNIDELLLQSKKSNFYGVFLIEYSESEEILEAAYSLVHQQADHPGFVFFVSKAEKESSLIDLLSERCHDFLIYPFDQRLIEKKIRIATQIVTDKRALMDASEVLERYSQHIDHVAAERTRQLIHAERLSTLGVMSTEIAHEIKTPVAYASSSLQTAKIYWDNLEPVWNSNRESLAADNPQLAKAIERIPSALDRIDDGLERVAKLTTGLKKFGRRSQGELSPLELNSCVSESLSLCEGILKTNVQLETELAGETTIVLADPQQIEQVLINLLVNAVHALEGIDNPTIKLKSCIESDQTVLLSVEDNGPGIPPDTLETIWEPFYTTKESEQGTGLGLAISRSILTAHNGSIEVSNVPNGGARFEIRLPLKVETTE